jgi:hypothetical protein
MGRRYFPLTAMAGRLFHHGGGGSGELSYLDEEVVDGLLKMSSPMDRKIHSEDELKAALEESARRGLPTITLWVVEGMEESVRSSHVS